LKDEPALPSPPAGEVFLTKKDWKEKTTKKHLAFGPIAENLQQVKNDDYSTIIITRGSLLQEIQKAVTKSSPSQPAPAKKSKRRVHQLSPVWIQKAAIISLIGGSYAMAKYLIQASYTAEGVKGLVKEGGSKRKKAVERMIKKLGGKVEAFYFAFGDSDVILIVDVPDHQTMTAFLLAVGQSGAVRSTTTVLITTEQVDKAVQRTVDYRPPGK